jgi:hypothetical protein
VIFTTWRIDGRVAEGSEDWWRRRESNFTGFLKMS